MKKRHPFKSVKYARLIPAMLACALLWACADILRVNIADAGITGGYEQLDDSQSDDALTVSVRIGGANTARYAAPSSDQHNFVYAARLYPDGSPDSSDGFVLGALNESGSVITFQFFSPDEKEGLTIEVFAFKEDTAEADFSADSALLSGSKSGLKVEDKSIAVDGGIRLLPNTADAAPKGTVSLKVKVPENCSLEIDDTANFTVTGTSPDFTVEQNGEGIPSASYPLTFTVKNGEEILAAFSDSVNVLPGMLTDTWLGLSSAELDEDGARKISVEKTFYVLGSGGWCASNGYSSIAADDANAGSFLAPFATVQKAIDRVISANDGASEYTIYVDGTLTQDNAPTKNAMAYIDSVGKSLSLTIKALSASEKATLDANNLSCVVQAKYVSGQSVLVTLERLIIMGGNATSYGGGIYTNCNFSIKDCEITGNTASSGGNGVYIYGFGNFTMSDGNIISGNLVQVDSTYAVFTMTGGEIKEVTGTSGAVYVKKGKFNMSGGKISGNYCGINIDSGNVTMTDGEISGNNIKGGVCVQSGSTFTMSGGKISGNEVIVLYTGGGVSVSNGATFTMSGGEISGNTMSGGGKVCSGVFINKGGILSMKGDAKIAEDNDVYLDASDDGVIIAKIEVADALTQDKVAIVTPSEYELGREILYADGTNIAAITDDICAQFALTPNPSGGEWIIAPDESGLAGILTKEKVPGGIEITTPGLETYTFAVTVGDDETPLSDGMTLHGGDTVTLKGIVDSQGNTPSGECAIKIQDGSGDVFTSATGDAASTLSVTVPALPNEQTAKIYLELTLDGGTTVINKAISVTISG